MAKEQNYKNHIRFYPPHHFVFYPVMLVLMGFTLYKAFTTAGDLMLLWLIAAVAFACLTWLGFMLRQHYALTLQNRLVLQELRYRYLALTGARLEPLEVNLSEAQLFALRFAPDAELPGLVQRAVEEQLSADAIKKTVKNWKPDHRRV